MAEPTTYSNYVSPGEGVDWSGLSDKFSTKLKGVEEKRQLERDTLDKMALDNTVLVSSYVQERIKLLMRWSLEVLMMLKERYPTGIKI